MAEFKLCVLLIYCEQKSVTLNQVLF